MLAITIAFCALGALAVLTALVDVALDAYALWRERGAR
jgi:hypothetical protein